MRRMRSGGRARGRPDHGGGRRRERAGRHKRVWGRIARGERAGEAGAPGGAPSGPGGGARPPAAPRDLDLGPPRRADAGRRAARLGRASRATASTATAVRCAASAARGRAASSGRARRSACPVRAVDARGRRSAAADDQHGVVEGGAAAAGRPARAWRSPATAVTLAWLTATPGTPARRRLPRVPRRAHARPGAGPGWRSRGWRPTRPTRSPSPPSTTAATSRRRRARSPSRPTRRRRRPGRCTRSCSRRRARR